MSSCLCFGKKNRVSPFTEVQDDYKLELVRDDRNLCIRHFNRRERSEKLQKEVLLLKEGWRENSKVTLEGLKLSGSVRRKADTIIFFIHGVGGSSCVWKNQMDFFSKLEYEVIAFDLIGHGFSDTPKKQEAYTFNEIAFDVLSLFDSKCKKKNVIVGHSYGPMVTDRCCFAAVLARQRPRLVSRLIMISGGGPTPLAPQTGVFSLPNPILTCIRPILTRIFDKYAFNEPKPNNRRLAFDVPTFVLRNTMRGQVWPEGDRTYHSWIRCPTLLIHGAADKLVRLDEECEMQKAIEQSHLDILSQAGHMVMMEKPAAVNEKILKFINT